MHFAYTQTEKVCVVLTTVETLRMFTRRKQRVTHPRRLFTKCDIINCIYNHPQCPNEAGGRQVPLLTLLQHNGKINGYDYRSTADAGIFLRNRQISRMR